MNTIQFNRALTVLAVAALPLSLGAAIVNVDLNGTRNGSGIELPGLLGPTYEGQGAVVAGSVWNGLLVDSRQPDGSDNDDLTVTGSNFLDSEGNPTTVGFTIGPVGGGNSGANESSKAISSLLGDWAFVGWVSPNAQADFSISGLGSAPTVDLYFYNRGDGPGTYTIGDAQPSPFAGSGPFSSSQATCFKAVPVVDGQIVGSFSKGTAAYALMGGFTIVLPEPGLQVKSTSPLGIVRPDAPIAVEISEYMTSLNPASVQVFLNDQAITSVSILRQTTATNTWTIRATPVGGFKEGASNTVRVLFADTGSPPVTNTVAFSFEAVVVAEAHRAINLDIDGWRGSENPAITYVGKGAAGGGAVFNGLAADSSGGDDNLTVAGENLLDSVGDPTSVSFTLSPVAGENLSGTSDSTSKDNLFADFAAVGFQDQVTGTSDFTIGGLAGVPTVDLYFYFREDPYSDGRFASSAYNIATAEAFPLTPRGIFNAWNTVHMEAVPVLNGNIVGKFTGQILGGGEGAAAGSLSGLTIQLPPRQPYVREVLPSGDFVRPDAAVSIKLQDYVTIVDTNSIQLVLNGKTVTPSISKAAGSSVTTLSYTPPEGFLAEATNTIRLIFADNATPPLGSTNNFSFFVTSLARAANIVNIDFNGARTSGLPLGPTYSGQGAAGGGSVFNGVIVNSAIDASSNDDNLRVGGTNLLNSLGEATTVFFTIYPVAGGNSGAPGTGTSKNIPALLGDWLVVNDYANSDVRADFQIGGLPDAPIANLYFYHRLDPRDDGHFGAGNFTIPGVAGPTLFTEHGFFSDKTTTFFKSVPISGGTITGTFWKSPVFGQISGMTIEVPPPQVYVKSISPAGPGIGPDTPVKIELGDYANVHLESASVRLLINDQDATPLTLDKTPGSTITTVTYTPPGGFAPGSTVNAKIIFGDHSTPPLVQTQELSFGIVADAQQALRVINLDINGTRNAGADDITPFLGATYQGFGPAGGGSVWNGITADSRLPDGTDENNLTLIGNNLLDSIGKPTTVSFTMGPVAGCNSGASGNQTWFASLIGDWAFVGWISGIDKADFTIGGLGTNQTVDLYFYCRSDGPGIYTIPGATKSGFDGSGSFTSANTQCFGNVPVISGSVTGSFTSNPSYGLISGLTIVLPPAETMPPGPLSVDRQGGQITLSWTGAGTLQSADKITGPWTDLLDAASPNSVATTGAARFFRLRK